MNTKIIIGLFIVLIFFAGCESNFQSNCEKYSDKSEKFDCYSNLAIEINDHTICDKLEPESAHSCYSNLAIELDDYSICDKMELNNKLKQWKYHCYSDIAVTTNDPTICNNMEGLMWQFNCYHKTAIRSDNYLVCDNLEPKLSHICC